MVPEGNKSPGRIAEEGFATLEKRIKHLEDIEAIRNLLVTYANSIDTLDFDRLVSIYTKNVHFVIGAFQVDVTGAEAAKAVLMGMAQSYRKMRHKIVNVGIDPDKGGGGAYFMLSCIEATQNQSMVGEGGYRYKFVKVDGHWLISEQIIDIAYLSPAPWKVESV